MPPSLNSVTWFFFKKLFIRHVGIEHICHASAIGINCMGIYIQGRLGTGMAETLGYGGRIYALCHQYSRISHVLQAIRLPESLAKGTIRISLGKNNTIEDVNAIVTALKKITSS